jgi:hypothetical protein
MIGRCRFLRRVRKTAKSDYHLRHVVCLSVRPSLRMEKLGFHWKNYKEI